MIQEHWVEILYITGVILCIYPVGLLVLSTYPGDKSDKWARGLSFLTGVCFASLWPMFLVGFLAYNISRFIWVKFVGEDEAREKQGMK